MMNGFPSKVLAFLSVLALTGCASSDFSKDMAKAVLEASPVQLNGEQLLLSDVQVSCGDREELWLLTQQGPGRAIGRLTDAGRALHFSDDVRVSGGEATVQVTGKFALRALQVPSFQDEGKQSKVVEARTAVVVNHDCFKRPLPTLMGIRKGEFTAGVNPMFRLKFRENWTVEELLH